MSQQTIYLDHAAATPIDAGVLKAMEPYLQTNFYNPSAGYAAAIEVRKALDGARKQIAHWLGTRSNEIIFTAGGTEANNMAIHGVMSQFPDGNVVVSSIEHESVLAPAHRYDCREVAVKLDGRVNLDDLRSKVDDKTVLVSIMYANNEIGTIQPLREISKVIAEKRAIRTHSSLLTPHPLFFHTDACQAANYLDLHMSGLGVDMMTLNAGKIYGPKQTGVLAIKAGIKLVPLVDGGGQERGLRSGTENVAGAIGMAAALAIAQTMRHEEVGRLHSLQQQFFSMVEQAIPEVTITGSTNYRLPNNVHFTIAGQDNERLLIQLDEAGILAAAGSACSASSDEPSHVLRALGLTDSTARSSLRFTLGRMTSVDMIERCVAVLKDSCK